MINELDAEVVNFYEAVARQDPEMITAIQQVANLFSKGLASGGRDEQAAAYYAQRDLDRGGGLAGLSSGLRAARFFVVNQLAFSGMRRFNADGEFNIPFGHYKSFNNQVITSPRHVALLKNTTITCSSYEQALAASDNPRTFIFLDPPYTRVMKTYSAGSTFGEDHQRLLAAHLKAMQHASWMVVIDKSELTLELYADHIVATYPVNYGVNIKNRFSQAAEHIVATNYVTASGVTPPFLKDGGRQ